MFAHWWIMDESPRWLWTQGRHAEAIDIVAKAMKMNRNPNGLDKQYYLSHTKTVPRTSAASTSTTRLMESLETRNKIKSMTRQHLPWAKAVRLKMATVLTKPVLPTLLTVSSITTKPLKVKRSIKICLSY